MCDQFGKPTYCEDLAEAILALPKTNGIIHFVGGMVRSRFQMAIDVVNLCKERGIPIKCRKVIPVLSAAFPTPAPRPPYSVLDTENTLNLPKKSPAPGARPLRNISMLPYRPL